MIESHKNTLTANPEDINIADEIISIMEQALSIFSQDIGLFREKIKELISPDKIKNKIRANIPFEEESSLDEKTDKILEIVKDDIDFLIYQLDQLDLLAHPEKFGFIKTETGIKIECTDDKNAVIELNSSTNPSKEEQLVVSNILINIKESRQKYREVLEKNYTKLEKRINDLVQISTIKPESENTEQ